MWNNISLVARRLSAMKLDESHFLCFNPTPTHSATYMESLVTL